MLLLAKVIDRKYLFLGIFLGFFLLILTIICSITLKTRIENNESWIIRSYEDTVVLLNNGQVIEVFNDIIIDTLPNEDKAHLEKGISFLSKDEALMAIEDYDG